MMNKKAIAILGCVCAGAAQAQVVWRSDAAKLTTEGFINATTGTRTGTDTNHGANHTWLEGGVRLFGQYNLTPQATLGVRVEANANPDEHVTVGERSVIWADTFGRIELGRRRGLPDSLVGYAPNTYAFTSSEFGVTSGRTLDPGGTLATSFLNQELAARINAVSGNGVTSAFFGDNSPKLVYVSPKFAGTEVGLSWTPKIDHASSSPPAWQRLIQAGVAYQRDFGQHFFRLGGSASHATAAANSGLRDLDSVNAGAELNLGEEWDFGINLSHNSNGTASTIGSAPVPALFGAHGITASVNYNTGKWVYGAFLQRANGGSGNTTLAGRDQLSVAQIGLAYRIDTRLRVFAAGYHYRLTSDGPLQSGARGNVFLAGVRRTL